ncbi:hypothetical protein C4J92_3924 [Pseudomonas sp. R3-18-08]|nr:hypothetical protein C4J92_3924 [Pseudomonas sp. R3-18-08]
MCETYRHSLEVYGDSCHNSRAREGVTEKTVGVVNRIFRCIQKNVGGGLLPMAVVQSTLQ